MPSGRNGGKHKKTCLEREAARQQRLIESYTYATAASGLSLLLSHAVIVNVTNNAIWVLAGSGLPVDEPPSPPSASRGQYHTSVPLRRTQTQKYGTLPPLIWADVTTGMCNEELPISRSQKRRDRNKRRLARRRLLLPKESSPTKLVTTLLQKLRYLQFQRSQTFLLASPFHVASMDDSSSSSDEEHLFPRPSLDLVQEAFKLETSTNPLGFNLIQKINRVCLRFRQARWDTI
ncbi:hypothetical protein BJ508DRAFT_330711 [Ascobolus immersus RN42]|uniref:Uncharacterized protein n=1 Tax=Ascobolus immersus RN42 TaxID=1160509 RepID=A0A3N4HUS8_ASCIM|nr:hypothetical protein BJ508DRAFT_330711 [Ascobolus immersus RN42]